MYVFFGNGKYTTVGYMLEFHTWKECCIPFPEWAYMRWTQCIFARIFLITHVGRTPRIHLEVFHILFCLVDISRLFYDAKHGVLRLKHFRYNKPHIPVFMRQVCRAGCEYGYIGQISPFFIDMMQIGVITSPYILKMSYDELVAIKRQNGFITFRINDNMAEWC